MGELRFPFAVQVALLAFGVALAVFAPAEPRVLALEGILAVLFVETLVYRATVTEHGIVVRSLLRGSGRWGWKGLRATFRGRDGLQFQAVETLSEAEDIVIWSSAGRTSFPKLLLGFRELAAELERRGCLGPHAPPPSQAERLLVGLTAAIDVGWRYLSLTVIVFVAGGVGVVAEKAGYGHAVPIAVGLLAGWVALSAVADFWLGDRLLSDVPAWGWVGAAVIGAVALCGTATPLYVAAGVVIGAIAVASRARKVLSRTDDPLGRRRR